MNNITKQNLSAIASITIETPFWKQKLFFEEYSKTLIKVINLYSDDYGTKTETLGKVKVENMIVATCEILLNDMPKISGFGIEPYSDNLSHKDMQFLESCLVEKEDGGVVLGEFYVLLDVEQFDQFYNHSNNLFHEDIVKYIELLLSFSQYSILDYFDSIEPDKIHKYILDQNKCVFHLESLIDIATDLIIKHQKLSELRKKEKYIKIFGESEKLQDLQTVINYYKSRNWKIPAGKLMHIVKIHNDINDYDHIYFLLESWLFTKKFPRVSWSLKNYNSNGNNYFLRSLLNGKQFNVMKMLIKVDTEKSKSIYSKLSTLGKNEVNRVKHRHDGLHKLHFGWRTKLCIDEV